MRIGIDISQIVYEGTGVGRYVAEMVRHLTNIDRTNEYILFGASLRKISVFRNFYETLPYTSNITLKTYPIPPTVLSFLWNSLHIVPVEWLIGRVDVFWSSDWTQPPLASAAGITTVHDLIALKYPQDTHARTEFSSGSMRVSANIPAVHRKRLERAKRVCDMFLCDSESTKKDLMELLNISGAKIKVVYPGFTV